MPRRTMLTFQLVLWAIRLAGQDLGNLQIHGFATQGFLYSSANNYLTMPSSHSSLQWTEGGISVNDPLNDSLRVGMQIHTYQMGQFGGPNIELDWALGDYRVNDQLGFRAGKIKLPMGLYNDAQDVDSVFLWTLLPQGIYPVDNRDDDLELLGVEAYGERSLGAHGGRVHYSAYYGESTLDSDGGYVLQLSDYGVTFPHPPSGKDFGGDLRWVTPLWGLMVGASVQSQKLDGTGPEGTLHMAPAFLDAFYAEWKKGKASLEAEYCRSPMYPVLTLGPDTFTAAFDQRAWYGIASYQVTPKLQVGAYYSHDLNKSGDTSLAENHSKDWVVSGRYDFNQYFYGKVEGHFLRGTGLGHYASTNPNGLQPYANMLAVRVGFTF
jgi:hypothetical protein